MRPVFSGPAGSLHAIPGGRHKIIDLSERLERHVSGRRSPVGFEPAEVLSFPSRHVAAATDMSWRPNIWERLRALIDRLEKRTIDEQKRRIEKARRQAIEASSANAKCSVPHVPHVGWH